MSAARGGGALVRTTPPQPSHRRHAGTGRGRAAPFTPQHTHQPSYQEEMST
jgi:hypothetical protein